MSGVDVAAAELRAKAARARLRATVDTLQERLDPRTVARDAVDGIADTGGKALNRAADAVERHPAAIVGAAAAIALVTGRHRIARLFRRRKAAPVLLVPPPDSGGQPTSLPGTLT